MEIRDKVLIDKYNEKCDKHFTIPLNESYEIKYHSDEDDKKFVVLENDDGILWGKYKIICTYNLITKRFKEASEIIMIEKAVLDDKMNLKKCKTFDDINDYVMKNILNNYIGYVVGKQTQMLYFIGIEKIIRF